MKKRDEAEREYGINISHVQEFPLDYENIIVCKTIKSGVCEPYIK